MLKYDPPEVTFLLFISLVLIHYHSLYIHFTTHATSLYLFAYRYSFGTLNEFNVVVAAFIIHELKVSWKDILFCY